MNSWDTSTALNIRAHEAVYLLWAGGGGAFFAEDPCEGFTGNKALKASSPARTGAHCLQKSQRSHPGLISQRIGRIGDLSRAAPRFTNATP